MENVKKAIILAAGEGQRMRPLTLTTPKPLLKIKGKAIIEYVFDALPPEISEVIVIVKYFGDQIKNFLGSKFKNRKVVFAEGSDRGTAYSFLAAKPLVGEENFLLVYGDEMPNPEDVKNCVKKGLSAIVFESKNPKAHGIANLRANGSMESVIEKPEKSDSNLAVDGILVLNNKIFDYKPLPNSKGEYYFTSLLNQFVKDFEVWPVKTAGFVGDLTTPADLERIEKML